MRITVKPYLLKRRKKTNGKTPVYLRITQNRKYSLLSTGIDVEAKDWNPVKCEVRSSHPSYKALNQKLKKQIAVIESTVDHGSDHISRKQIINQMQNKNQQLLTHARAFADELLSEGKYHPHKQTLAAASKFTQFAGTDIRLKEITPQKLNEFITWLQTDRDDFQANHANTIVKTMSRLKAIIRDAYKKDLTTNQPFLDSKYEKPKSVDSQSSALDISQLIAIENLELEAGSSLWHTRNYFMFSFYNAGIRWADLARLRWKHIIDGRLIYQMGKTGRQKNIRLEKEALQILDLYRTSSDADDYIFPIIKGKYLSLNEELKKADSANTKINLDLKIIQEMAGIETVLKFHMARHTWATFADGLIDRRIIQKALGHSKLQTTENYIDKKLGEYKLDESMRSLAEKKRKK